MKVLLLCASHNDLGLIKALRKLGAYIIVTGNIPNLCGQKYADEYVQLDYSDKDAVLALAKEKEIDAICQCCNDFGVYTASYVAEKMNLKGYDSYETTLLLHNKDRFKEYARKNNLISPISEMFSDTESAVEYVVKNAQRLPLIVKPTDASAGKGICKVTNLAQARETVKAAFEKSRAGKIVVEPFISGSQHGFCTFLHNQRVVAVSSNNEYSILNPYRVEIDTFPASNYAKVKDALIRQIEWIAHDLKLKDGIFHLQYIMNNGQPQIIEVMRRILGNMYSVPANMLNGFDWDYWEVRAKVGLPCDDIPHNAAQEGFYAYKAVLANENGIITRIKIPEEYDKYLVGQFFIKHETDEITKYMSEPVGFLFFMFSSQEEMENVLIKSYRNDLVEIEKRGKNENIQ